MGDVVVVQNYFALTYYVACVVLMLVDYFDFINCVMAVLYYMLVTDYPLGSGAGKDLAVYSFGHAVVAAVCAITIHDITSVRIDYGTC